MEKRLAVGLTATIEDTYQAVWGSGITQNVLFLYRLLHLSGAFNEVVLVDLAQEQPVTVTKQIAGYPFDCVNAAYAAERLDVLIEVGTQLWEHTALRVRERGGRIVSLRCGNAFIDEIMGSLTGTPVIAVPPVSYDAVWVLPMHVKHSKALLEVTLRTRAMELPYLWEPDFVEAQKQAVQQTTPDFHFGYQPGRKIRNIAICEPNISPVKMFQIPLLACEQAYRQDPTHIGHVYVMNAWQLKDREPFIRFVNRLDLMMSGVASFEGRMDIVHLLASYADVVVSHQWDNGLNYLYLDALYGGYPLVHNSEFIRDVGYYYPDSDAIEGARQVQRALSEHDLNLEYARLQNMRLFSRYSIYNRLNQQAYVQAIHTLWP